MKETSPALLLWKMPRFPWARMGSGKAGPRRDGVQHLDAGYQEVLTILLTPGRSFAGTSADWQLTASTGEDEESDRPGSRASYVREAAAWLQLASPGNSSMLI